MKKNLLRPLLLALMVLVGGSAWAGDKTVVKYSFDDAMSPSLTAGNRVSLDYGKTSVITSTTFLNAWNNTNGDPAATTVSLGSTDLSSETWTLSFEWAACGGCNSKADHTTLKAGDTNLFDLTGNSNWNTTVTITYAGSDGTKTLPVPGCDKGKRFTAGTGDQYNTETYWHHIVVTGSASGVKMTITNSSTGNAVVEDVLLSATNVNPTSLIIEPCCGGAIGIDELSLTYFVEGEVIQTPTANYTAVNGIERTITATCDTEGATLYYSTDGENWTEGASVTVSASGNVYFKAVKGNSESDVLTFAAVAGEAITLNAPTIVRSNNTTVTISADQANLLLSPTATIKYTYGNEAGEFTGSKTLTVAADATITAYAEATGYTTSATSERAVALFPEYVNTVENTPTVTTGTTNFALSTETITVSEREYAALLLDGDQWGTNVYLQNLSLNDPIVWGIRNGNWYINTTDPQWILIRNLKAGDIVVVDVTYPAADMVNATYSEKFSFGTKHAYIVNADGDVEFDLRKINAKEMNYFYGVYSYSPMSDEEVAAIEAFQNAKTALAAAIAEAKAIETEGKEGVEALQTAIATAEATLAAEDATTESLTAAKNALAEAVAAFKKANFDPATAIANADFEADEPIANKVCTYAKDVQEGQVANMQPLTGWTIVENGDARAAGTFAYGSTAILGGDGGNVPAAGPNGETTGKALGLEAVWSATTQYTQDITLPAGEYLFEAVVYNAAGTATLASNLIGIDGNYCATKNYPVGKWTKDQVKFTLAEEKTVTVSLGINAGNVGNGSAPHLFIDHVRLYGSDEIAAQELAAAKENALSTIGALATGDALFLYDTAAIEAAKAAVNSAETIEAVNAAVAAALAAQNKPAADKEYVITNKTTELVLSIGSQAVTLQQEGVVKFTEVEGGWVLSNNAETPEYIFKTTTAGNTWTLSTTANKDEAYVVNFNLVDGAYTIQGANGLFGTDNTTEGSAVYANKTQAANGLWTIAEKPATPDFEPAYGTLWTEADGSSVDENEFNYITLENKYFKDFAKVGDTIKVAISSVGNQPAGSRPRIVTTGTLKLKIDDAGETLNNIQQGTTSANLILTEDEIAKIQEGFDVVLSWKYLTVAQVDLVEKKAEIDEALLAEAEQLASDESAVAVGKLLAAIEIYKSDAKAEALRAAINQFKADNADQEADQTAKVATNGWKNFNGAAAGVCATQFAPAINTYDGRTNVQLAEVYEGSVEGVNRTGTIIYQDITGLQNGTYKVGFYGNAFFTSGRGFDSPMADGAEDVAYVFANDQKAFITAHIATSTTENDFRQFDVEVTDGTIKLGMGKENPGTNWHTMQIYQLTWFTTAKKLYAVAQVDLKAAIAEAKALKTEYRTEGLDAFNEAIATAEQGVESNWYNNSELQDMIKNLKAAMENFKAANYYKFDNGMVAYIIDAESGKFMAAGHDYGTRGIVNETGLDLTFETTDNKKVNLNTQVSNGGNNNYLGNNLYMDGAAFAWAFEYQGFGFHITNGTQYISIDENDNLVLSDTPREWIVVTAEGVKGTRLDEMAEATPENPADATFLLKNPNFNRNDQRVVAWVVSEDCTNKNLNGGNGVNNCAESYHSTFTISQTITDAPTGTYTLKVQGFYRQDGEEAEEAPVFFINNETVEVPVKTGEENSMSAASESFTAGQYYCEPENAVYVNNGTLTVGVQGTGVNQWVVFDNFRLTYYGSANTVGITEVNTNVENNVKSIYNLNGQKVQKTGKGLYIINGKKVVLK